MNNARIQQKNMWICLLVAVAFLQGCGCSKGGPVSIPSAPTNLTAKAAGSSNVNLTWQDNSTNETGFAIERSIDGIYFIEIGTGSANTTYYADSVLDGGTYYYRVYAYNSAGNSDYSNIASVYVGADFEFTYPSPRIPFGQEKPVGIPLKDATNVPLNIIIIGSSTDWNVFTLDPTTFTMTVNDGTANIAGRIEISFDQSSALFFPADFLKPNTTYTITASQSNPTYFTTVSFATVPGVGPNPASIGNGYAFFIAQGSMTQPPGIGGIMEPFFQDMNMVIATIDKQQVPTSPDAGFV